MKLRNTPNATPRHARVRQGAPSVPLQELPTGVLVLLSLALIAVACETSSGTPPITGRTLAATAKPSETPPALATSLPTAPPNALPTALATALPTALATALPTVLPTALPTAPPTALPTAERNEKSNIEEANERFRSEGHDTFLILVDAGSTDIEGVIYRDLQQRNFRVTTGPDEGIDTRGVPCYPNCLFVLRGEANASTVEGWLGVLRHEYRHIVQARNNPNMARDFRDPNGRFTPYAAFSEVCADYGLNVAADYRAQERMDELKSVVGGEQQPLLDRACEGDRAAYEELATEFNRRRESAQAFEQLFPPYD